MLEKTERANMLYDFYGSLLRDRARLFIERYFVEDLSLSEIAEMEGISRQAVHDNVRRALASLEHFENELGLVQKYDKRRQLCTQIDERLAQMNVDGFARREILEMLDQIVREG